MTRVPAVLLLGSMLAVGAPVAAGSGAISIADFSPAVVAEGERVVIRGDFAALRGARPVVYGAAVGERRRVRFRAVDWSDTEIVARVRRVPSRPGDRAEGKRWRLHVGERGRGGPATVVAAEPFTTTAPVVVDLSPAAVQAGTDVLLRVAHLGRGRLRVGFGDGGRSRRVRAERAEPGAAERRVWVRVPHRVGNGVHEVYAANRIGKGVAKKRVTVSGCFEPPTPPTPPPQGIRIVSNAFELRIENERSGGIVEVLEAEWDYEAFGATGPLGRIQTEATTVDPNFYGAVPKGGFFDLVSNLTTVTFRTTGMIASKQVGRVTVTIRQGNKEWRFEVDFDLGL